MQYGFKLRRNSGTRNSIGTGMWLGFILTEIWDGSKKELVWGCTCVKLRCICDATENVSSN